MRFLLVLGMLLFPLSSLYAQNIEIKGDKLFVNGIEYCKYTENGTCKNNMMIPAGADIIGKRYHPEASGDSFKDISLGDKNSPFVSITAMVAASANMYSLTYYYHIVFATGDIMRLVYNSSIKKFLLQDIINYHLIEDGFLNQRNVKHLISKWQKKPYYMHDSFFRNTYDVVTRYNDVKTKHRQNDKELNITVINDSIFLDAIKIATFEKDNSLPVTGAFHGGNKLNPLYRIKNTSGIHMGYVKIYAGESMICVEPAGAKKPLWILTTDREISTIIKSSVKALIVYNEKYAKK